MLMFYDQSPAIVQRNVTLMRSSSGASPSEGRRRRSSHRRPCLPSRLMPRVWPRSARGAGFRTTCAPADAERGSTADDSQRLP